MEVFDHNLWPLVAKSLRAPTCGRIAPLQDPHATNGHVPASPAGCAPPQLGRSKNAARAADFQAWGCIPQVAHHEDRESCGSSPFTAGEVMVPQDEEVSSLPRNRSFLELPVVGPTAPRRTHGVGGQALPLSMAYPLGLQRYHSGPQKWHYGGGQQCHKGAAVDDHRNVGANAEEEEEEEDVSLFMEISDEEDADAQLEVQPESLERAVTTNHTLRGLWQLKLSALPRFGHVGVPGPLP